MLDCDQHDNPHCGVVVGDSGRGYGCGSGGGDDGEHGGGVRHCTVQPHEDNFNIFLCFKSILVSYSKYAYALVV